MRVAFIFVSLVLGLLCIAKSASPSTPTDPFLGIAPKDEKYYRSSDTIACRDGSKKFTRDQLNDDFCDCPDATDEPGTSACPRGKFYCRNSGHAPMFIFSSRINDGICDCCDGSDEYDGAVKCVNTCWQAGKVARERLMAKIATYQEGVNIRRREIEQAKVTMADDEAELSKLKSEVKILKGIVEELKDRKEQIEKAEEKERLQKEKEEKEKKEAEEKVNPKEAEQGKSGAGKKADSKDNPVESTIDDEIGIVEDSLPDQHAEQGDDKTVLAEESKQDSAVESKTDLEPGSKDKGPLDEVKKMEIGESENTEGLSSEELGRLVASRWTGENSGKQSAESNVAKDNHHPEGDAKMPGDAPHEEYDRYASDAEDGNSKYDSYDGDVGDDDDIDDEAHEDHSPPGFEETTTSLTWWEKIRRTARNILKSVNPFQTPVNLSEAEHVRKEYEEANAKLSKMKSRLSNLTEKLKLDFGPENQFFSFYGRCFEGKQSKYDYKVCPYKQATQMEGHSTTHLGNWDKFEEAYKVMVFSNGDKCWNGPDRSLKVKLRCGLKNEITDVDEPSRCEYSALLASPALCSEEKLKEWQDKLAMLNGDEPRGHDEL